MMSKVIKETNGKHKGETIYCPVNAYGACPYCSKNNVCHIYDPMEECDDFAACFDSWEEWEEL
jgi:hypothetical protein